MSDQRKPKQDQGGHATIPPGLRPFLGREAQAEEHQHRKDPAMEAVFAKINDAIGEDVQEIDPDVGVGNVSRYVGPVLVPDAANGKAFTAKVKIAESKARSDQPAAQEPGTREAEEETTLDREAPSSRSGRRRGERAARLMAQAAAERVAAEHAPTVSVLEPVKVSAGGGRSRWRAVAVSIAALGIFVAVGIWVALNGPRKTTGNPGPVGTGAVIVEPVLPAVPAMSTGIPLAPSAVPPATVDVDAGTIFAPREPISSPPRTPKGHIVRGEDPYDAAAPLPVKTVEPVEPPSPQPPPTAAVVATVPTHVPPTPTDSAAPKGLPYRKKDQ